MNVCKGLWVGKMCSLLRTQIRTCDSSVNNFIDICYHVGTYVSLPMSIVIWYQVTASEYGKTTSFWYFANVSLCNGCSLLNNHKTWRVSTTKKLLESQLDDSHVVGVDIDMLVWQIAINLKLGVCTSTVFWMEEMFVSTILP